MSHTGKEWVLKECKDKGVEFVRLWFTDILGMLKSFAITIEELESAPEVRDFARMYHTNLERSGRT